MSLYREAGSGRRRLAIAIGAALAAVGAIVLALALALGGEETAAERQASLQDDVQPALQALELVPIHYESANATTHAAAADQLAVARETVADVEDELRARDAAATSELLRRLDELDALVRTTGRDAQVERGTADAAERLRELVGLAR
jgi:hypothetical protein